MGRSLRDAQRGTVEDEWLRLTHGAVPIDERMTLCGHRDRVRLSFLDL